MRPIARIQRLPASDWRLLMEAVPLVTRLRVALWLRPFEHVRRRYTRRVDQRWAHAHKCIDLTEAKAIGRAVRRSSRLVPAATCLPQALATRVMLERRGVRNELCFGVARSAAGSLEAHAWIEVENVVVIGNLPDLMRFSRMPELPELG